MNAWNSPGRNARRACLVTGRAFCPILCRFQRWRHNSNTTAAAHPFQARQNWWETGCISSPLASLQLLLPSEWLTHSSAHWPKPQHTPQVPPRKQPSAPGTAGSCPLGSYFLWSLYQHSVTDSQMTTLALIKAEPPKSWALSMGPSSTLFFHGIYQWSWWSLLIDNLT